MAVIANPGDLAKVRAPKRTSFHRLMEDYTKMRRWAIQLFCGAVLLEKAQAGAREISRAAGCRRIERL
jgi:hypothetical protein